MEGSISRFTDGACRFAESPLVLLATLFFALLPPMTKNQ